MFDVLALITVAAAILGMALASVGVPASALRHGLDARHQVAFGSFTWTLIGFVTYLVIAAATAFQFTTVATLLMMAAVVVTPWFIVKARWIRFWCPACFGIWIVHSAFAAVLVTRLLV